MDVNRILFFNVDRIGDVVRSSFLFRALKKRYPASYLACVAAQPGDEIMRHDPFVDDVFMFPHYEIRSLMKQQKTILHMAFPVFKLLEALKAHTFDLVINPYSEFGALSIRYLKPRYVLGRAFDRSGSYVSYGEEAAQFYSLMTNRNGARARMECNFNTAYGQLLKALDIECTGDDLAPRIYTSPDDDAYAETFFTQAGVRTDERVIGVQLGAFSTDKMWPIERFAELLSRIERAYQVRFLVTGSEHEATELVPHIQKVLTQQPLVAAGRASIMQSAALIQRCCLYLSNDTGPMHIAAAQGIPIVALFGKKRTVPAESQPWGDGHTVLVKDKIEDISVEEVMGAVINRLSV